MICERQIMVTVLPGGFVDRKNAARSLNRSPKTLSAWARAGIGPLPVKVNGRVVYRWDQVLAFGAGSAVTSG